ncbi:NETI motif-containing protein [Peribacillus simplex]|uniref:NETI motif-containing protein n=1 Tax=Peribacillus simplex TaxID=1478 RepID=UPI003D2DC05A
MDAKEEDRQNRVMEGIGIVSKKSKEKFEVIEGETIDACLDRIKAAGYFPVRRTEEPIFVERIENGKVHYEPVDRKIVFEAKLIE